MTHIVDTNADMHDPDAFIVAKAEYERDNLRLNRIVLALCYSETGYCRGCAAHGAVIPKGTPSTRTLPVATSRRR